MIALTPRHLEIAALVAEGMQDVEVGAQLGITRGTVKSHIVTMLGRTGARNRVELAVMYVRGRLDAPALRRAA